MGKILKHIVTWECPRDCSYCINKWIRSSSDDSQFSSLDEAYKTLRSEHSRIAITGGEPALLGYGLVDELSKARKYFSFVSLWTQDGDLVKWVGEYVDDIVFSVHSESDWLELPDVSSIKVPVYMSCLVGMFRPEMLNTLRLYGYAGIQIKEQYPDGKPYGGLLLTYANFSVRYVRAENCFGDGHILTPELVYMRERIHD